MTRVYPYSPKLMYLHYITERMGAWQAINGNKLTLYFELAESLASLCSARRHVCKINLKQLISKIGLCSYLNFFEVFLKISNLVHIYNCLRLYSTRSKVVSRVRRNLEFKNALPTVRCHHLLLVKQTNNKQTCFLLPQLLLYRVTQIKFNNKN